MTLFDKLKPIADRLAMLGDGPTPFDTIIEEVHSATEVTINGRRTLMCGSNNYLGLSFDARVIAAAREAAEREGAGTTGSRAANGTFAAHRRLERDFSQAFGKRHAMLFTTGYQANLGLIAGLCDAGDTIVVDAESHASIYDGARLSGAQLFAFRHNSPADLAKKLERLTDTTRCLVVVESLYSISGDIAPLSDIVAICRKAGAFLVVDEAHGFGAFGSRGLGVAEAQGALSDIDFIVGTFSKSLAGVGGFVVSNHEALKLLHFNSRPYVFTASGSPANIASAAVALKILRSDATLRDRLWQNIRRVRAGLSALGFSISSTESPIVAIELGSAEVAIATWRALLAAGLYTNIVLPPACKPEACLLRTSYSAAHTPHDIDRALGIFERIGRELGLIAVVA